MSGPVPQEHSHLKVLHDFQYKTAEDREIIIKKNERLYLLQKTNDDWWQVVRNLEQRSFYVPATYVRELSKTSSSSTRKNSEEDRDNIFEPPEHLSYKSMPRESSNAMRNVKKWLAGAMDSKPEPPKTFYSSEVYQRSEVADGGSRIHGNAGSMDHKTKSLERELRPGHFSDREEDGSHGSPRSRESLDYHENSTKINRLSTSPKNIGLQFRMEPNLQDPFRRELESSLDRRNLVGKIGTRVRTKSSNSEGSQANNEIAIQNSENFEKIDKEISTKIDGRKINLSIYEDQQRRDSESSSGNSRNSRSLDFDGNKFSVRRERSVSPKPIYGRQMTIGPITTVASSASGYHEKSTTMDDEGSSTSVDHKILNDKRRTWAVEELMSELTQMCKERVVNKKPNFQLKSTEIKTNFDPIEKLTREIHEMNRLRTETNTSEIVESTTSTSSPLNVCKIAINTERASSSHGKSMEKHREINPRTIDDTEKLDNVVELRKICSNVSLNEMETQKPLKSPKSPKILDEYNEANILNDCNSHVTSLDSVARSLSPDKPISSYHKRNNLVHSNVENVVEPCYSNVKINPDKSVKLRPKLKIKIMEPTAELRLTPSLEKLASEIQFLPASRTNQTKEIRKKSNICKDEKYDTNVEKFVDPKNANDSLENRSNPETSNRKLDYKGSFKTKREEIYKKHENHDFAKKIDSIGLKKSSTLHCTTIPDCYRRFRRNCDETNEIVRENTTLKRRSRSLSDLEIIDINFSPIVDKKKMEIPRIPRCKPIPMPRTKLPGMRNVVDPTIEKINGKCEIVRKSSDELIPKTIPEQRKISREKRDYRQNDETHFRELEDNSPQFYSLTDKYSNNFDGNKITRNLNIESSTAVGFKSLLCASDSGSDNCLQSKELLSSSTGNLNDSGCLRPAIKSRSSVNFNDGTKIGSTRESFSDEQILSSNASSEALHSQSESEITATNVDVSSQPSPIARTEQDSFECASISLPPGWIQKYDSDTGQICFINEIGDKWFSSNDAEGKIYFFEENSNESSWVLPTVTPEKPVATSVDGKNEKVEINDGTTSERKYSGSTTRTSIVGNPSVVSRELPTKKPGPTGGDWPHLYDGNNMLVLKEGVINRTKITENGKKLRKNWSASYAVLTELFLLFFKDAKTFTMMKTGQSTGKPDISVDLNGALVEHGDRASSRKNVYMISTVLGLQVLIQSDNTAMATEWFQEVHGAIRKLPSGFKSHGKLSSMAPELRINSGNKQTAETNQSEENKRFSKVARSRSMKMKRLDDSLEDLSGSAAERQTKIKAKLRWFFQRRPAVELLVKNGIYKDEPAFGSYLSDVCPAESPRVPLFVKTCIEVLESKEENMKTDGLYRASGNLSQIQKIRLQVDQYKLDVLAQEEDVHVLAGALKLFFRELKEPLIPSSFFQEAVNASMLKKSSAKVQCFRDIAKALPAPNYDTLQFLLKHLLRVTSYQEFNRMHIPNLAIVFGPTLMWPAEESANMALDFMQQNFVIECLLSEYNKIFK